MQMHYLKGVDPFMGQGIIMSATPNPSTESTLTARYQTTIPAMVRDSLGLSKGDTIRYSFSSDNQIVISRVESAEEDPVIGDFLAFLARDMETNPQHIQAVSSNALHHVRSLVDGIEVDLEAPLLDEDA